MVPSVNDGIFKFLTIILRSLYEILLMSTADKTVSSSE